MTETSAFSTDNKKTAQRHCFLDLLRVAATCAVILLHTVTGIKDTADMSAYPAQLTVFLIVMDFCTWCVPVFIMISGYLFLNPEKNFSYGRIILKYCRRIVLALILFGVPYACIELVLNERSFRIGMIGEAFIMVCRGRSWSHMWYLYLALFLYLITPPLKRILDKLPTWSVYVSLSLLYLFGSILPFVKKWLELDALWALPDEAIYLFYYLCGYLFVSRRSLSEGQPGRRHPGTKLAAAAVVLLLACMTAIRLTVPDSVQLPYNYPFTVVLSLLLFFLASRTEAIWQRPGNTLKKLGAMSFTIYLIHPVFINIAYKFLHLSLLDYPVGLSIPLFFAAVLALSVPTAWVLRKIPGMARYVL